MIRELLLELSNRRRPLITGFGCPDLLDLGAHCLEKLLVAQGIHVFEPVNFSFSKQITAVYDLIDGLLKRDGDPLACTTLRAGLALQDADDAVGIIGRLQTSLSFRAD